MKTIEQAAKDFAIENKEYAMAWLDLETTIETSFKNGVKFAQRWIPIVDEKPTPYTVVLVKISNQIVKDEVNAMLMTKDGRWVHPNSGEFDDYFAEEGFDVTHWRIIDMI